jgi:hypothetical protein
MPGNVQPIYTRVPDTQWVTNVITANASNDLTSGTSYLVFTADATNGGFAHRIKFRSLGANGATVARVWINNGLTTGTAANNTLWDEISLVTTSASTTAATPNQEIPLNIGLPPGYRIYVTILVTLATGYNVTVVGGKY